MTSPRLEEAIKGLMDGGKVRLILDMTDTEFMSSAGWWVLIEAQKKAKKQNGELVLVNINDKIRASLNLVGMDNYFKLCDSVSAAVKSFSS
jgi:anti-sigma B factor antagonist